MVGILIKNRLKALVGSSVSRARKGKEIKKASPLKIALFALLYLYLIAVFLFATIWVSRTLASVLLPGGADWLYWLVFMGLSLTLLFILGIFETKVELFECKDNDLLLSMPIRPSDIVLSRAVIVLIYNYVINAVLMFPAIVCYAVYAKSLRGTIGGILLYLLIPLLATALASGVGYLVAEISRRLKNKNLFTIIFCLAFLFLYFWVYSSLLENVEGILATLMGMSDEIAENFKILYFIGQAGVLKPLALLSVALVSILSAALAYFLVSMRYIKIATDKGGVKKSVYKAKKLRTGSPLIAIMEKDIRHLFGSAIYFLNGALGLIFCIAIGVLALIKIDMIRELSMAFGLGANEIANVSATVISLCMSTVIISCCALSLEGKNFWILKSMPIPAKTVLSAKAMSQFAVSFLPVLISSVLVMIAIAPSPFYFIVGIVAAQIISLLFSVFGILVNVAFPKFEYHNEAQVVKQSLSTLVTMISSMLLSVGLIIGSLYVSGFSAPLGALFVCGAPAVLCAACFVVLLGPASKRYESFVL